MSGQDPLPRRATHGIPTPAVFVTDDVLGHGVNVRVLRGSPTPEEIAAVTSVLSAAVVEEASRSGAVSSERPSAWERSTRIMRTPLTSGPGQWRNFSA